MQPAAAAPYYPPAAGYGAPAPMGYAQTTTVTTTYPHY
jgi:hypothetical protein